MNKSKKENILLFINIFLSLSFLIILVYLIKKNNLDIFNNDSRFFYNILLTFFLLIFHTTLIFSNSVNFKINLSIFSISSYFSILFIEIIATFYLSYFNNLSNAEVIAEDIAKEQNIFFDSRSIIEVYEDEKKNNDLIVRAFAPAYFSDKKIIDSEIYPLGGISNSLTLHCNESGYYSTYQSDRFGFNNPDYVWNKEIDYLLVGDSFTHGACVDGGFDIASNLRTLQHKKNFVNIGMGSNDTLLMYSSWKEYGTKLKPKTVLWMHFENDIIELNTWGKNNELALNYFYNDLDQNLIQNQELINKKIEEISNFEYKQAKKINENSVSGVNKQTLNIRELKNKIRNIIFLRSLRTLIGVNNVNEFNPLFTEILVKAKKEVNSYGGNLIFVYLPSWERYKFKYLNKSQLYQKKKILDEIEKISLDIIDLDQLYFKSHPDPLSLFPFRTRGHYTVDGYMEISKTIIDELKKINLKE